MCVLDHAGSVFQMDISPSNHVERKRVKEEYIQVLTVIRVGNSFLMWSWALERSCHATPLSGSGTPCLTNDRTIFPFLFSSQFFISSLQVFSRGSSLGSLSSRDGCWGGGEVVWGGGVGDGGWGGGGGEESFSVRIGLSSVALEELSVRSIRCV